MNDLDILDLAETTLGTTSLTIAPNMLGPIFFDFGTTAETCSRNGANITCAVMPVRGLCCNSIMLLRNSCATAVYATVT